MSRATTKIDLIIAANEQFDKLCKLIDTMSDEQQNALVECRLVILSLAKTLCEQR